MLSIKCVPLPQNLSLGTLSPSGLFKESLGLDEVTEAESRGMRLMPS